MYIIRRASLDGRIVFVEDVESGKTYYYNHCLHPTEGIIFKEEVNAGRYYSKLRHAVLWDNNLVVDAFSSLELAASWIAQKQNNHLNELLRIGVEAISYQWDGDYHSYDGAHHLCLGGFLHFQIANSNWSDPVCENFISNVKLCDGSCKTRLIPVTRIMQAGIMPQFLSRHTPVGT